VAKVPEPNLEIRKRTTRERVAYLQGYKAGLNYIHTHPGEYLMMLNWVEDELAAEEVALQKDGH